MPKLIIDQREIEVPPGTKVIEAAERLGIIIPRFCYHPGLGSFGACRMCAVKFEAGPVKGLEMSCMVEAHDGMVVSTTDPEAMEFRKYVIEWLMLHHPHDCPVCDEGGHCLLQDETVSGGHGLRRYLGKKRTYHDQDLGVFVQHEMNRCIHCWRCRNFYQDFAGYRDLGALQIANRTYFGRYANGALECPFSGNLIDLCPTGVYTDRPSRYKARRWEMQRGPSVCLHCSLGCNTTGSSRFREMLRQEARFNEAVNGYFICDRGRYGFFYTQHPERPRQARVGAHEVDLEEAIKAAAARLSEISKNFGPGAVACLGSSRSSLETQGELKRFCHLLGWPEPRFFLDHGMERKVQAAVSRLDDRLAVSMREIEGADFIVVVGADPLNEAPMLALALRQAYRRGAKVVVIDPRPVFLPLELEHQEALTPPVKPSEFEHLAVAPGQINLSLSVLLKMALSHAAAEGQLEPQAAQFYQALPGEYPVDSSLQDRLAALSPKLGHSQRPIVVCGTDIVRETTLNLAADLALLLKAAGKSAGLFYLLPGPNAFGAALLSSSGSSAENLLEGLEKGAIKALILVENDPFWHYPDQERWAKALNRLELVVALDYLPSPTVKRAHIVLPTLTVFEGLGSSFVNQEGRLQWAPPVHAGGAPISQVSADSHPPRVFLDYLPGGEPRTPGEIFQGLAAALTGKETPEEDLWTWLSRENPVFARAWASRGQPHGVRLIPDEQAQPDFSLGSLQWEAEGAPPNELELLLVDRTFGTEELAAYSPVIQQVGGVPQLLMHGEDICRLGLGPCPGGRVVLRLPGGPVRIELKAADHLAAGVMILPRHRLLAWQKLPEWPVRLPAGALERV